MFAINIHSTCEMPAYEPDFRPLQMRITAYRLRFELISSPAVYMQASQDFCVCHPDIAQQAR